MELIKVENGIGILNAEVSKNIAKFEKAIKEIKEKEEEVFYLQKGSLYRIKRQLFIRKLDIRTVYVKEIEIFREISLFFLD